MRGKKASLAILLLATLLTAFAAAGTASAAAYTSGTVSGDQILYNGETNWKNLSDAVAAGDTVGDVTVDGTSPVTIPEGLKITGSVYNNMGVLLTVNGEQELSAENTNGIDTEGKGSNVNFRNLKSLTASSDGGDINGIYADSESSVDVAMSGKIKVDNANGNAHGIYASDGSTAKVSGATDISVTANNPAYYDDGLSSISATYGGNVDVAMSGKINASAGGSDIKSSGVYAYDHSYVKISGATGISATGLNASDDDYSDAYAIDINDGSSADISLSGSDADIMAAGRGKITYAKGICAYDGSSVDVSGVNDITVSATGTEGDEKAWGIDAGSSNVGVSMSGSMTVKTTGKKAFGVLAKNNAKVNLSGMKAMDVTADNGDAYAVRVANSSNADVTMSGKIGASAGGKRVSANGVSAQKGSYVKISGATGISAAGLNDSDDKYSNAYAVNVRRSTTADISLSGSDADITATGSGIGTKAHGINALMGSSVDVSGVNDITVSAIGARGNEKAWGINTARHSSVDVSMSGNMTVQTTGNEALGILAKRHSNVNFSGMKAMNVSAASGDAYGIRARSKSSVTGSLGSMTVSAGEGAFGIEATGSSVDATMTGDMTVKGSQSSTAIDAEYGSTVTVTGAARHKIAIDSEVSTDSVLRLSDGSTINVSNADVLNLGKTKVNSITAKNDGSSSEDIVNASNSYIKGNVAFYDASGEDSESYTGPSFVTGVSSELGSGSLTVNLKDGSTLEGAANAYDGDAIGGILSVMAATTPSGAVNINVFDTSKWLVTGDSNLGKGTLANNGTVAFSEDGAFKTVYVNKLAGVNGVYEMSTNGTNSDQIIAETKDSSASGVIHASAKSGSSATYQKRVATPFITVKNEESTSFTLAGGSLSIGAWNYVLRSGLTAGGQTEWYLASDPQNPVSPLALAATAAVVMPDVWYLETNALYSQANSFNADREDTTVWGQAVYNKTEWDNAMSAEGAAAGLVNADGNEVTQKFYGLTGGIDKRIKTDKGQWFAGWMIGYGEGDLDFTGGDGDLDSFHTGLYTVYRTDNDWYLAALAKYNSYKTSVTARANNAAYDGEYTQNGWGLSFLAGKQFVKESGWYLEPQFELGWHRTAGADYELAGLPVDVESMTSLRARAGLGFGKKRVYDNGRSLEFFVRASVVKEFDGDTNVRFFADQTKTAFDPFKVDYSGTWGQYKLGLNYYAPDKGFTLHGALTYENGGDRESPIGLELGGSWNIGPKAEEETEK